MESSGLKQFLKAVGNPVFSINTICVGLDGVCRGLVTKPDDLTISWDVKKPKVTAIISRNFVLRASLVFVEEALVEYFGYLNSCSNLPDKIQSAVKPENGKGAAGTVKQLAELVTDIPAYWTPMEVLLVRWRNKVVHNKATPFEGDLEDILLENSLIITEAHAGIDISQTLKNYKTDKITLKDFSTLIAVTIKYVRHLDATLNPELLTSEDLFVQLQHKGLLKTYRQVVGVNGEDVQWRKFKGFMESNFYKLPVNHIEHLFKKRFEVLKHI